MAGTAKSRWDKLHGRRSGPLDRARDAAKLTIPSLMPPDGHDENTALPQPYQSLGARGVNNLASKLLLALMPPSTAFFRLASSKRVVEEAGGDTTEIDEGLRRYESDAMKAIERSNLRTMLFSALKHLIVSGNALLFMPKSMKFRMFPMDRFVVVRDAAGTVMEIVIKETVDPSTLPDNVRNACACDMNTMKAKDIKNVDVYTYVELKDGKHVYFQEINDIRVPGSDGEAPAEESPFLVLRWSAIANEDYGRGMVEEYIGDLRSLEGLNKAIVAFAAAAARVVPILKPNSTMKPKDLQKPSGQVVVGDPEDVALLQMEKFADFQVAKGVLDDLSLRLSHAFLLRSGTVRDAERVTAEEIRAQAQELEDVLGGVYTVQSQELQLPLVRRVLFVLQENGELARLPKGSVEPTIITGFEALGRGHELNRIRSFIADAVQLLGPEVMMHFDADKVLKRLATGHNVDVEDTLRDPDEVAQEKAMQAAAPLMEKAVGPMAGAMAKGMVE